MAGSTIVDKEQRARTVRFQEGSVQRYLQPISGDVPDDLEDETEKENGKEWGGW